MSVEPQRASHELDDLARHVKTLLQTRLGAHVHYHDVAHTFGDVVPAAERLAIAEGLPPAERRLVKAAALLHDTGFTTCTIEHEQASVAIARDVLPSFGFDGEQIEYVARLILATRLGSTPECRAEAIMKDADLDVLGRIDFWAKAAQLRRELHEAGERYDDHAWWRGQKRFLSRHVYQTRSAERSRGPGKRDNLQRVEAQLLRLNADLPLREHG
jgi:predicted metal-dependent HD superfamily phosphohydrolase